MAIVVASLAWLYPTRTIRAQVLSLRRRGGEAVDPELGLALQDGDTLVLSGKPEPLALATQRLLSG